MTHHLFAQVNLTRTLAGLAIFAGLALVICGCASQRDHLAPLTLHAPYERTVLWAVAPLANESGVSTVDGARVADLLAEQAQQSRGINTVPVNRVLGAMRRLNLNAVATPGEARMLMQALGVDGLIVGTVTAYDPYNPPKFGAALQLFTRETGEQSPIDPIEVSRATRETAALGQIGPEHPVAQAADVFDAANHQTLLWLDQYSRGRTAPASAFGRDIYLVDMELFTQFAVHRLLADLLLSERARLQTVAAN